MRYLSYFNPYNSKSGHIYSCDMLRLKFEYNKENEFELLSHLNSVSFSIACDIDVQYFQSFNASGYRHLFVYKKTDKYNNIDLSYSFTIGILHNMDTDKRGLTGFIEFNPNKCDMRVIEKYMHIIRNYVNLQAGGCSFILIRYDLAIDFKVARQNVKLLKKGKRTYTYIRSKSLTEYLGKRHTNGFCKLYDKREELGLDYDVTRLEITCTDIGSVALPVVSVVDAQCSLDFGLNATDSVLVALIRQQEEQEQQYYLSQLGRVKRQKLEPYIIGTNSLLEYDKKGILHVQDIVRNAMYINF